MTAARAYFKGRSELAVAVLLGLIGIGLGVETHRMAVVGKETIGPQFFPYLVAGLLVVVSVAMSIQVIAQRGAPAKADDMVPTSEFSTDMLEDLAGEHHTGSTAVKTATKVPAKAPAELGKPGTDWRTVGLIIGGLAAFAALLNVLGFVLAASGLFWLVCYALGSKRPIFDIPVSVIVASLLQIAFGLGLGLPLPTGFIGALLGGGA